MHDTCLLAITRFVLLDNFRAAQKHRYEFAAEQAVVRSDGATDRNVHHRDTNALRLDHTNDLSDGLFESR